MGKINFLVHFHLSREIFEVTHEILQLTGIFSCASAGLVLVTLKLTRAVLDMAILHVNVMLIPNKMHSPSSYYEMSTRYL